MISRTGRIIAGACAIFIIATHQADHTTYAIENPSLIRAEATAYCIHGTTASGEPTREGICAGKWLGKTLVVYQRLPDGSVGDIIGIYECTDSGGQPIKEGKVIDIWKEDLQACQELMDRLYEDGCAGRVYIQIFDAKG